MAETASQPVAGQDASAPVQRGLLRINAPASATIGQQFTLEVRAASVTGLNAAPFVLTYDPSLVEFVSAGEGGFLRNDGVATVFGSSVNPAMGTVSINLARKPGSAGVSGDGVLSSLVFRAKKKGLSSFGFNNVAFSASDGKALTVLPFSSAVEIK